MMHPRRLVVLATLPALLVLPACDSGSAQSAPDAASAAPSSPAPSPNGVAALSPAKILQRARAASVGAGSVRVRGSAGQTDAPFALDIRLTSENASKGFFTVGGRRIEFIRVRSTLYLTGGRKFWRSIGGSEAADLMTGKYIKTADSDPRIRGLISFTRLKKLYAGLLDVEGKVTKGGRKIVNGVPAIALVLDGDGSRLYIATVGEPYVLRTAHGGDHIDFVEYGEDVRVQAPPDSKVVDMDALRTGG